MLFTCEMRVCGVCVCVCVSESSRCATACVAHCGWGSTEATLRSTVLPAYVIMHNAKAVFIAEITSPMTRHVTPYDSYIPWL
jgi:hypothetical protein